MFIGFGTFSTKYFARFQSVVRLLLQRFCVLQTEHSKNLFAVQEQRGQRENFTAIAGMLLGK